MILNFSYRGVNREAMEICKLKTLEPEEEYIGLNLGDNVSWLQATLMKVRTVVRRNWNLSLFLI
jgi:hypothetical protein